MLAVLCSCRGPPKPPEEGLFLAFPLLCIVPGDVEGQVTFPKGGAENHLGWSQLRCLISRPLPWSTELNELCDKGCGTPTDVQTPDPWQVLKGNPALGSTVLCVVVVLGVLCVVVVLGWAILSH